MRLTTHSPVLVAAIQADTTINVFNGLSQSHNNSFPIAPADVDVVRPPSTDHVLSYGDVVKVSHSDVDRNYFLHADFTGSMDGQVTYNGVAYDYETVVPVGINIADNPTDAAEPQTVAAGYTDFGDTAFTFTHVMQNSTGITQGIVMKINETQSGINSSWAADSIPFLLSENEAACSLPYDSVGSVTDLNNYHGDHDDFPTGWKTIIETIPSLGTLDDNHYTVLFSFNIESASFVSADSGGYSVNLRTRTLPSAEKNLFAPGCYMVFLRDAAS